MPIYAYRCDACGHAQDVLRKISDPLLSDCPACGAAAFKKQLTAAGFQLKGSGWYATDFRNGNGNGAKKPEASDAPAQDGAAKPAEGAPAANGGAAPAATPAAAAPAAAGGCGSSCACH